MKKLLIATAIITAALSTEASSQNYYDQGFDQQMYNDRIRESNRESELEYRMDKRDQEMRDSQRVERDRMNNSIIRDIPYTSIRERERRLGY